MTQTPFGARRYSDHVVAIACLLTLVCCGSSPVIRRPPAPAPALPSAARGASTADLGSRIEKPAAPHEAPELQSVEAVVASEPGAPLVVLENPPRGDDMGGLLGTPSGPVLVVHFIDVGQGDGALIQTPNGKSILVDSGPPPATNRLLRYLSDLELHQIDLMITSHPHLDHFGGSVAVMRELTVGAILDSGYVHETPEYAEYLKQIEADKIPVKIARRGRKVTVDEGVLLEVLGPEEPLIHGSRSDANANSVIFRLTYKDVSFLFVGDAEEDTEQRLLRGERSKLKTTVLKVAHHGSAYASSDDFIRAARPRLAVASYSKNNVYGHPAPPTVERFGRAGVHLLGTARDGNIVMITDGTKIQVFTVPRGGGPYGGARLWYPGRPAPPERAGGGDPNAVIRKVDVNHASINELTRLPGIGQKIAEKIIAYRRTQGRFQLVEDLSRIKGLSKRKLDNLRPYVDCGPGVSP